MSYIITNPSNSPYATVARQCDKAGEDEMAARYRAMHYVIAINNPHLFVTFEDAIDVCNTLRMGYDNQELRVCRVVPVCDCGHDEEAHFRHLDDGGNILDEPQPCDCLECGCQRAVREKWRA